jgi:hypothetical protein
VGPGLNAAPCNGGSGAGSTLRPCNEGVGLSRRFPRSAPPAYAIQAHCSHAKKKMEEGSGAASVPAEAESRAARVPIAAGVRTQRQRPGPKPGQHGVDKPVVGRHGPEETGQHTNGAWTEAPVELNGGAITAGS